MAQWFACSAPDRSLRVGAPGRSPCVLLLLKKALCVAVPHTVVVVGGGGGGGGTSFYGLFSTLYSTPLYGPFLDKNKEHFWPFWSQTGYDFCTSVLNWVRFL